MGIINTFFLGQLFYFLWAHCGQIFIFFLGLDLKSFKRLLWINFQEVFFIEEVWL
jgi:hypothetical protein